MELNTADNNPMETKIEELEDIFQRLRSLTKKVVEGRNAAGNDEGLVGRERIEGSPVNLSKDLDGRAEDTDACDTHNGREPCAGHGLDEMQRMRDTSREREMGLTNELNEKIGEIERLNEKLKNLENHIIELNSEKNDLIIQNKEYREALIEARGTIRVVCRIRPGNIKGHCRYNDRGIIIDGKSFSLDHIFPPEATQKVVFQEFSPIIESVLNGYNVCVLAYGQTGSGKTHTMLGNEREKGLIYNMIDYLSAKEEEYRRQGYAFEYSLRYVEIYNEGVYDLVTGEGAQLIHDSDGIHLKNCTEMRISKIIESKDKVNACNLRRRVGETKCNQESSRSHLMLMVGVLMKRSAAGKSDADNLDEECRSGTICMIDLAGSERLSESKAENERLKETQNINKSLSSLGDVITALKRGDKHVPFRNSKLTHLLQEYLGAKSRITMIVNINAENVNETVCSLRFAAKVSECHLGASERNVQRAFPQLP